MHNHPFAVTGCSVIVTAALALPILAQQEPSVFRSGTKIVPLLATVTDEQRRLVPGLLREDFQIYDNRAPREITLFDNEVRPISVIVMLDTSASMTGNLDQLYAGAEQFFLRLLPDDQARVGAFNDKIQISAAFTSDRDALIAEMKELDYGNPTRLYDAIDVSLDELRGVEGRRVILVFTDGDDTASKAGFGRVEDRARNEEVMVYAIGLESTYFNGQHTVRTRPDSRLRKIADETGGGYFELKKTTELGPTFSRIAEELHSQYVLGFSPDRLDGKVHKLEVRVTKPGLTARSRRSYVASPD